MLLPAGLVFVAACNSPQLLLSHRAGSRQIRCGRSDKLSALTVAERLNGIKKKRVRFKMTLKQELIGSFCGT